jgi:hypothetical protein
MAETPYPKPSRVGYTGPGGGKWSYIEAPVEYRGTTVQVCGLWPFGAGSGAPLVGAPMGRHLRTNASVCCDPISWFTRARLIQNPGLFVAGLPGLGKSTAIRRMVLYYLYTGVIPLVLGDLKPDYADLIRALGGQVVRVGPGLDRLNPLDAGPWRQALTHLNAREADRVRASVASRRLNMVVALMTLIRRAPVGHTEETVLVRVLAALAADEDRTGVPPVLSDVLRVVKEGPEDVRAVTLWRNDDARYRDATDDLVTTLLSLLHGPLATTFEGQTTAPIDLDTNGVCVDISGIDDTDEQLTAAGLLSTWSYGFAAVDAAHLLADLGLAPQRQFFTVMDELWRALRVGHGLVDRADKLTRLNRQKGTGTAFITHSLADLDALPTEEDRAKARGFAERSPIKLLGGLPDQELDAMTRIVPLSRAERAAVVSWADPPAWSSTANRLDDPPGLGNFLIKVGGRPGIPVHLEPTETEKALGNTNARWWTVDGTLR